MGKAGAEKSEEADSGGAGLVAQAAKTGNRQAANRAALSGVRKGFFILQYIGKNARTGHRQRKKNVKQRPARGLECGFLLARQKTPGYGDSY
jgi:hypothetical protein